MVVEKVITVEQVIEFLEPLFLKTEHLLDPVEKSILKFSWENKTYEEMEIRGYSSGYIRTNAGPALWKKLTEILRKSDLIGDKDDVKKKHLRLMMEPIIKRCIPIDLVGQTIASRFKIVRLKSKGEFGNTYIGEDLHLKNRPCFIKQLRAKSNPNIKNRFEREARALYQLGRHHQIPSLLYDSEEDTGYFLVQEFIEGIPLSNILLEDEPSKPWREPEIIKFLIDILNILEFVHKNNIIHRDIKPSNLVKNNAGEIFLINFGSIKQIDNSNRRTFFGTPGYMAPEQSHGIPLQCSDIYAVAMVAIQALTGLPPRQFKANYDTGKIIWHEQASVSSKLANILDKMAAFDYNNRYQSVKDVLQDL